MFFSCCSGCKPRVEPNLPCILVFSAQLLDKLPHTVRGMGMTLLRPMVPHHRLPGLQQHRLDTLANLAGYMVVVSHP